MSKLCENEQDYCTIFFYYEKLAEHNLISIIEIDNLSLVRKQIQQICTLYGVETPEDLPQYAGCLAISKCCKTVKSNISNKKNTKSMGNIKIGFNSITQQYNCQTKHKSSKVASFRRLASAHSMDDQKTMQADDQKKFANSKIRKIILEFCAKHSITIKNILVWHFT